MYVMCLCTYVCMMYVNTYVGMYDHVREYVCSNVCMHLCIQACVGTCSKTKENLSPLKICVCANLNNQVTANRSFVPRKQSSVDDVWQRYGCRPCRDFKTMPSSTVAQTKLSHFQTIPYRSPDCMQLRDCCCVLFSVGVGGKERQHIQCAAWPICHHPGWLCDQLAQKKASTCLVSFASIKHVVFFNPLKQ